MTAAVGLRLALDPWLAGDPFISLFGAVIVAAWYGGLGPGLAAAVLGYAAAYALFLPGFHAVEAAAYALSAGLIAALGGARRSAGTREQASEARFRAFADNSPAAVFMKDEEGRYLYMNAAAERIVGTEQWKGRTDLDLLPREAAEEIRSHDREVLAAGAAKEYTLSIAAPGGRRHFYSTKFPLHGQGGERLVGAVTVDITAQQRAAEELRLVTDATAVALVRVSRELRYVWANRVYAGWVGRSVEDLRGRTLAEVIGDDAMKLLRPHFERVLAGERVAYDRLLSLPRLGQRWFHAVTEPTRDAAGRVDGWVAAIYDIHERREAADALEAARAQLQLIADSLPAAVALVSADLRLLWVNRRYAEWLGTPPEQVIGRSLLDVIGRENLAAIRPHLDRVRAGEPVQYERLLHIPTLGERWVRALYTPVHAGETWVAVVVDIHERKVVEERLRAAEERKDAFLATLAHELRNPLEPIRNAVAILGRKGTLDPELAWSREVIDRQVDVLARLADDLLQVAQLAGGKLALRKARIALERALDMALEQARAQLTAHGHRLSVLMPSEPVLVEADAARLAQALTLLLKDAARRAGAHGEITLAAELAGAEVAISLQASGAEEAPAPPAAAVGESLVHGIVALHGGRLESRPGEGGRGCEWIVRLPLAAAGAPAAPEAAAPGAAAPANALRVLVADDNRDAADSLQRILSLYGHEVRVAYDGSAAMALGEAFRPRVAVLDIGMPGANGYEVARHLRERCGGVKLIALTGWGQEADRRRAFEAGFDYHLVKPVDPGALNDLLGEAAAK